MTKTIIIVVLGIIAVGVFFIKCKSSPKKPKLVDKKFVVDEETIKSGDVMKIIDPIWSAGNIYDSHAEYLSSISNFSKEQQYVYAIMWYQAEVFNGGHEQFYFNSTGIVWKEALDGLEAIGATDVASILRESTAVFDGKPSFDRDKRSKDFDEKESELLNKLDTKFYESEGKVQELLMQYILKNKEKFLFNGTLKIHDSAS